MTLALKRIDLGTCRRLIVISDVHLRFPDDALSALFFKTLDSLTGTGVVVFLGDIFDFIYADSAYFLKRWKPFFDAAESLRARGFLVVFVEGNHDFGFHGNNQSLAQFFDESGDIEVHLTHTLLGKTILRHGDDVICKPGYERFRKFIKSNALQRVLTKVPHKLIDWACLQWANSSRSRHDTYQVDRKFINACLKQYIQSDATFYKDLQTAIFGHIHVDADFKLSCGPRFISGPDWISCPSILIADETAIMRDYIKIPAAQSGVAVIRDEKSFSSSF